MTVYTESLFRSLVDRARAFGSYVGRMRANNPRSDDGFDLALSLFEQYSEALVRQAEFEWQHSKAPARHDAILGLVREFFEKENWFDAHFARSNQYDIPHALQTLVRREFRAHGWNDYEPVLTVGAPDNFETHRSDLAQYLFGASLPNAGVPSLGRLPLLSVISVPYVEGTSALWHPIVIGHEVGHVRVEADKTRGGGIDPTAWISDNEIDDAAKKQRVSGTVELIRFAQDIRHSLASWVEEVACDLNTVRLFGPAGLSAIAEFLSLLIGSDGVGAEAPTTSHPPLSLRISLMLRFMEGIGTKPDVSFLEPWQDYCSHFAMGLAPRSELVAGAIIDNLDVITTHVASWGPTYLSHERATELAWARDELLDGIPVGTHCLAPEASGRLMTVPDVVAGAWMARYRLDRGDAEEDEETSRVLVAAAMPMHERRLEIDMLAQKSINSLEFVTLWTTAGGSAFDITSGETSPLPTASTSAAAVTSPGGAVAGLLSRSSIMHRLRDRGLGRLVVTPLLADAIGDAGVDLRLAPQFIVFRHSATTAFDALDSTQDPRVMQELVEKAWGEQFILHPGELVLAATLEYVVLPADLAGQVVTRSSYGRLGLITATAVQVQPGSRGSITLELVNHGTTPIALTAGSRIAQLVLFGIVDATGTPTRTKYMFPTGPEFSRVSADDDVDALRAIGRTARPPLSYGRVLDSDRARAQSINYEFRGDRDQAVLLQTIAESEGAASRVSIAGDLGRRREAAADAGVAGGEALVAYVVAGSAALSAMAATAIRFARALQRPTVIRVEDGKVTLEVDKSLPRSGRTYLLSDGSVHVGVSDPSISATSELVGHISGAIDERARRRQSEAQDRPPEIEQ